MGVSRQEYWSGLLFPPSVYRDNQSKISHARAQIQIFWCQSSVFSHWVSLELVPFSSRIPSALPPAPMVTWIPSEDAALASIEKILVTHLSTQTFLRWVYFFMLGLSLGVTPTWANSAETNVPMPIFVLRVRGLVLSFKCCGWTQMLMRTVLAFWAWAATVQNMREMDYICHSLL